MPKKASRKKAAKHRLIGKAIAKFFKEQQKYLDHHKALQYSLMSTAAIIVLIWGVPALMNLWALTGVVDSELAKVAESLYMENLQEAARKVPEVAEKATEGVKSFIDYLFDNAQAVATIALLIPNVIILWRKALSKK